MTGTRTRCLLLCGLLSASFGCKDAAGGPAREAPEDAGSQPPDDAGEPAPDAATACEARWPEPAADGRPRWIAIEDSDSGLRVIDIANAHSELLSFKPESNGEGRDRLLQWSRDGRRLAFERSYAEAGTELYVVDMSAEVPRMPRLIAGSPETPVRFDQVSWSPSGDHLVLTAVDPLVVDRVPPITLTLAAIEDGQPIVLSKLSETHDYGTVRWAPDGSQLFFQDSAGDRVLVRVAHPDQPVPLGHGPEASFLTANWSPDSRHLVIFDDALRAFDTQADPPAIAVLSEEPEPQLSVNSLGWSDGGRFLIVHASISSALRVFDMHATPAALAMTIELAQDHGATRFGSENDAPGFQEREGFRSRDYAFEPGGHRIVYAAPDVGWVVMNLATAEVASEPIAPLDAALLLGFSAEHELLWLDAAGIHATSFDGQRDRLLLSAGAFDHDIGTEIADWRSARIAPSGDRFALTGSGNAVQLMMMDDCAPLLATFEYPEIWIGAAASGHDWEWLRDSSGVVQQTFLESEDRSRGRARLELVRPGTAIRRTLIDRSASAQYVQFTWLEQPY